MGNVIGQTSNDIGGFIGNIFTAPFKATIGRSCVNVCSGPWDLTCFVEHFCLPDIAKLLLMSLLCLIILVFITLLFKLGICQCVVKSICKMSCAACATYWFAIGEMVCCLWQTLTNAKRVRRRRRLPDIEVPTYDDPSDNESSSWESLSPEKITPKRRIRRRGKLALGSKHKGQSHRQHLHDSNRNSCRLTRLRSRQLSVRVAGKSRKGSVRKMKHSRAKSNVKRAKIHKVKYLVD